MELGDQQGFKKRQRRRASGERGELGAKRIPWRVPGRQGSAGAEGREIRFLGLQREVLREFWKQN